MKPLPRSVGRNRPGAALLVGMTGLAAIMGVLASPGDASPRPQSPAALGQLRIGMNSCAARGCHGAVDSTDPSHGQVYIKDGAYTTWLNFDPHAQAYAVLLEPRSVGIAAKLKVALEGKPAHEAGLCLSCHATVGPSRAKDPEVAPLRDGISCEACHGPADIWQDKHLSAKWRGLPAAEKAANDGMTDLTTPKARAQNCVGCHVGDRSRGMDMNHDLIAAGHPRLNFEFATYQAGYPKHWKEKHEKAGPANTRAAAEFEAKSWAIGQVVTAEAALDLLAARALASKEGAKRVAPAPEAIWPEFSEYECFACHHGLTDPGQPPKPDRRLGLLPWQTWPSAMLSELAKGHPNLKLDPLAALQLEMARKVPDPDQVVKMAAEGQGQLKTLLDEVEAEAFDPTKVGQQLKNLVSTRPSVGEGWDLAVQHDLAIEALSRALKQASVAIDPGDEAKIKAFAEALEFLPDYDSPRNVSPPKKSKLPPGPKP